MISEVVIQYDEWGSVESHDKDFRVKIDPTQSPGLIKYFINIIDKAGLYDIDLTLSKKELLEDYRDRIIKQLVKQETRNERSKNI